MKRLLLLFIISTSIISLHAQAKGWTLNDCVLYAVNNSPRVSNQNETNAIYQQDYLEAIGKLLPSLNAGTNASFNFGRGLDEETNNYININSFGNNYNVSTHVTLFDGLANYRKLKIGRINKLKGKQELEDAKDKVAYDTMEAFYNVLYNKDLVKTAEEQLSESANSLIQTKRMEELGVKGHPDVLEAEAKTAEDTYNLTKQRNLLTISIIQLKEKMNFPIDEELFVAEEHVDQLILKVTETPYDIYEHSLATNPKTQIANAELEAKNETYKAQKGYALPSLSMGAGASTNFFKYMDGSNFAHFAEQFKNKQGEYVGFTLSIPLFNGFSRSANIKRAKAQLHMAENTRSETLRKLYSDIEQAVADANGQVEEYRQAVKQKEAAEMAHQVNLRKYEEGLIDPILLHTSSNRVLKAKTEEYKAKHMYQLKYKLVNYYKGEPLYIGNTSTLTP